MPRLVPGVVALALAAVLSLPAPQPTLAQSPFTDISGHQFEADIEWAYAAGITRGCTSGQFCPDDVVTREQAASFLVRMFGLPPVGSDSFSDDDGSIHEPDINAVAAAGVTSGCGPGLFCPSDVVNREQMASFITRAAAYGSTGADYFHDDEASIHEASINRLAANGVASGCGLYLFCPVDSVTRGQMAAFLHRVVAANGPPSIGAVLVGAGDIANCLTTEDEATAALLDGIAGTIFTAGDNAYPDGTAANFADCYAPNWGRHLARTRPAPGNHDYHQPDARDYFAYFGSQAGTAGLGYYAYDLGAWRVYSLNSIVVSPEQVTWLINDLAANPRSCVVAYWHHPRYATGYAEGTHGDNPETEPLWDALADASAELVLNGHSHHYERFAANRGVVEVISGTGGTGMQSFATPAAPGSLVRNETDHGVLKVTLHPGSYSAEFVPIAGKSFTDSFNGTCH